jgi:DNA modification methylase
MKPYYRRGSIAIYHGDARAVAPTLGPSDLVVTSPPYAEQRQYGFRRGGFDWARVVPAALASVNLAPRGQMLVNLGLVHRDGEVVDYWAPLAPTLRSFGYRFFGWYVWDQGSGLPRCNHGRFASSSEFVFHFNRQPAPARKFVPCKQAGKIHRQNRTQRNHDAA